jgi:hypothetical protein
LTNVLLLAPTHRRQVCIVPFSVLAHTMIACRASLLPCVQQCGTLPATVSSPIKACFRHGIVSVTLRQPFQNALTYCCWPCLPLIQPCGGRLLLRNPFCGCEQANPLLPRATSTLCWPWGPRPCKAAVLVCARHVRRQQTAANLQLGQKHMPGTTSSLLRAFQRLADGRQACETNYMTARLLLWGN